MRDDPRGVSDWLAGPTDLAKLIANIGPHFPSPFGCKLALIDQSVSDDPKHIDGQARNNLDCLLKSFNFFFKHSDAFLVGAHRRFLSIVSPNTILAEGVASVTATPEGCA